MYTTAEDWLTRFRAAGCLLTIDDSGMLSPGRDNPSDACTNLWPELQGPSNLQKWMEAAATIRPL